MKNKDTQLLEEAYKTILKEEASPMPTTDIFDAYEEVGMSAEMGMQDLITSSVQQILKEVPQEDQARAHEAVKGLWLNMVKSWSSLEGYQD